MLRISSHTPFPCLQERSLGYARDDGTGKRSPHICFQPITQKVAKGNAASPYRHPERSRGIFLAHRYSAVCETAEKGKPFAKEARKSKVQGRFLAALEMTVWGNGFISRSVQRICLESAIPVSSSRAKSRDLSCTTVRSQCEITERCRTKTSLMKWCIHADSHTAIEISRLRSR